MEQIKWFQRSFEFNINQNTLPSVIERLEGTPARLESKFTLIKPIALTVRVSNTWSILQNLGHLIDIEPLWQGRIEDIVNGRDLRSADLQNAKTELADHNEKSTEELIRNFSRERKKTLSMLESLDDEMLSRSGLHPRLKIPLRIIDQLVFVAEHDDHHLARISRLATLLDGKIES